MEINYSKRLNLLHALCLAEGLRDDDREPSPQLTGYNLETQNPLASAEYLCCYLTFKAIQAAERSPLTERSDNFDMLSVYQAFALLNYAFLTLPLVQEGVLPNLERAQGVVAKTLFAGLPDDELVEIIQSGFHKFQLIGDAEAEHWTGYRENLDKVVVAFVVASTDDDSPYQKEEILPLFEQLLSQLCEAFEN